MNKPNFIIENSKPETGSVKRMAYSAGSSATTNYRTQRLERGKPTFRRTIAVPVIPQFRGQQIQAPIPTVQGSNTSQTAVAPTNFQVSNSILTIRWPSTGKPL